jgi:hypothetical protein
MYQSGVNFLMCSEIFHTLLRRNTTFENVQEHMCPEIIMFKNFPLYHSSNFSHWRNLTGSNSQYKSVCDMKL